MNEFTPLTVEQKLLLYLKKYSRYKDEKIVKAGLTQYAIARVVKASRNYISELLLKLIAENIVFEKLARVTDERKRKKVYFLTDYGEKASAELESRLRETVISVKKGDGVFESCRLSEICLKYPQFETILDAVVNVSKDGILDLSTYEKGGFYVKPALVETQPLDIVKKVCILGDFAVGKTSLIRRYVFDEYDDKYITTIGTKVTSCDLVVEKPTYNVDLRVKLLIWDMMGQLDYPKIRTSAFRGARGALLVCDVTRRDTLYNLKKWITGLYQVAGRVPVVVLANKADLEKQVAFGIDELKTVAAEIGAPYYFTSAKTGKNVQETFYALADLLVADEKIDELIKMRSDFAGKPTIYSVTDEIIDAFCDAHGGHERAMPIVRTQINKVGFDFGRPTVKSLKELAKHLVDAIRPYTDRKSADEEYQTYIRRIKQLEDRK
jgi:small GTP-binding protein